MASIGSDNDFAPNSRQAIILINDGPVFLLCHLSINFTYQMCINRTVNYKILNVLKQLLSHLHR